MDVEDFFGYLDEALSLYKQELEIKFKPRQVVILGIKK